MPSVHSNIELKPYPNISGKQAILYQLTDAGRRNHYKYARIKMLQHYL